MTSYNFTHPIRLVPLLGLGLFLVACSEKAADKPVESPATTATSGAPDFASKQAALEKALTNAPSKALVADGADILSPEIEARLSERVKAATAKSGHRFAIVTVKSLDGIDAADYAAALSRKWALGRPDYDDGLMLLVAPTEKQVSIDRGTGLQKAISKDAGQAITTDKMIPAFKSGDFAGGIEAGALALATALEAVPNDTRADAKTAREAADQKAAAAIEAATKAP